MNSVSIRAFLARWLGVILTFFTVFAVWSMYFHQLVQLVIFMAISFTLVFMYHPICGKKRDSLKWLTVDIFLSVIILLIAVYVWTQFMEIIYRAGMLSAMDQIVSAVAVLLALEVARRTVGWVMIYIAIIFLLYAFFGQYLFPPLSHGGYDVDRILQTLFLSENGVAGIPMDVMFKFIFLFIVFGAVFSKAGGTEFFINICRVLFGGMTGGPAKVAVVSSGVMGTISGSAVANVVTTGTFTIPLMKKIGFESHVAGAVEAVASTGGQLMPPIMGAAAFIMADYLNVPYLSICKAALVPAVLYYLAIFACVHFYTLKLGIKKERKEDLPDLKDAYKDVIVFLPPLLLLIVLLVLGQSPSQVVLISILATIVFSLFRKKTRLGPRLVREAFSQAGLDSLNITGACAAAGVIVGIVLLTGAGLKIGNLVLYASGGKLWLALPFVMIASLVLGMGLPTVVCYILLAMTIGPSLVNLGAQPAIAGHLFIFYFGMLSMVTPPVGFAFYAGAAIGKANPMKTGIAAWKLALSGFLLPYMFIYNPELLLIGNTANIIQACGTALLGVFCLSAGIMGFIRRPMHWFSRALILAAALLLIKPGIITDIIGLAVATIMTVMHWRPILTSPTQAPTEVMK